MPTCGHTHASQLLQIGCMILSAQGRCHTTQTSATSSSCYDCPFLFLSLVLLCFPFRIVTSRVFNPHYQCFFYSNIFRSNCFSLEYSSQNIPLYYLTFHCLLLPSISFVISLTINIYKPHSSLLYFPTLVYLVLLASIDPLVTSSGFRQVSALLLSRCFLFEPLNP